MQLEAGKKYTDRRGRVYGPLVKTGSLFFGEDKETPLWNQNGGIDRINRDMDLVAEYVEHVQPVADPGEGYRLLSGDEITLPTDERAYFWRPDDCSEWDALKDANPREFVGVTAGSLAVDRPDMFIRRRLPPKNRTVVLKEWLCWDDCGPVVLLWQDVDPTTDGIAYNEFDHAHATGNTRTVEIPVT